MAARANLNVSPQVTEEFVNAQESRNVRIMKIRIEGENLVLGNVILKEQSAAEDFDVLLVSSLEDSEAAFILFCLTDDPQAAQNWLMVTWIPDGCRVRDKMLYSSSRDDLKRKIGLGYFKSEYAANYRSDISWSHYLSSLEKETSLDVLTENERLLQEEKVVFCFYHIIFR